MTGWTKQWKTSRSFCTYLQRKRKMRQKLKMLMVCIPIVINIIIIVIVNWNKLKNDHKAHHHCKEWENLQLWKKRQLRQELRWRMKLSPSLQFKCLSGSWESWCGGGWRHRRRSWLWWRSLWKLQVSLTFNDLQWFTMSYDDLDDLQWFTTIHNYLQWFRWRSLWKLQVLLHFQWFTMIYNDLQCFTMIYNDLQRFTIIYNGFDGDRCESCK